MAALTAWLSAPSETARQQALVAASKIQPIDLANVDRLPVSGLIAWSTGDVPRLAGMRPHVRLAILTCGLGKRLGLEISASEATSLDQLPFIVRMRGEEIVVEVPRTSERSQSFSNPIYSQWVSGVAAARVVIDCTLLDHVHSVLIAWMLQLAQNAKPNSVRIRGAKPVVATQLRQLRLDHLMPIE